ncbi:6-phosphofructokinase [soil metagenome]
MSPAVTRLALLTSGGDAPGMNAALWALTNGARALGWEVLGVREGLRGLLEHDFLPLDEAVTLPWARRGGTALGTARLEDFPSHLAAAVERLEFEDVSKLVILGGNGSALAAAALSVPVPTAFIPATIDNDVVDSDASLGFDTALNTALQLGDGIRDSAEALPRLFSLETLGGKTVFLAQAVALALGVDALLVPERPLEEKDVVVRLEAAVKTHRYALLVASEGYPDVSGVVERLSSALGTRSRFTRIGHAQRGGRPSGRDRLLARAFAETALSGLAQNESGRALWQDGRAVWRPFAERGVKPFVDTPL